MKSNPTERSALELMLVVNVGSSFHFGMLIWEPPLLESCWRWPSVPCHGGLPNNVTCLVRDSRERIGAGSSNYYRANNQLFLPYFLSLMQMTIPAYAQKSLCAVERSSETILETACWNIIVTNPPPTLKGSMPIISLWKLGQWARVRFTQENICFYRGSKHSLGQTQNHKLLSVWAVLQSWLLPVHSS